MLLPGRWIEFLRFFCNLLNSLDFLVHVYCACMQSDNKLNTLQKLWMCDEIMYLSWETHKNFPFLKFMYWKQKMEKATLSFHISTYKICQIFRHFSWQLISSHIQNFWLVSMMLQCIQLSTLYLKLDATGMKSH